MNEKNFSTDSQPDLMDIDDKLALFLSKDTLQLTIDHCVLKGIALHEVRRFTEPDFRLQLAKLMLAGKYKVAPPRILLIPKPDSDEKRKVYCNNAMDRIICTQIGHVYNQMYGDRIHPCCVSYQKGIGVPQIVRQISHYLVSHPDLTGWKMDIHHYFDAISEEARDEALRELDSGSCIDRIVWDYLHDDVILDEHGQVQHVYKGIAQGFAVSPFLANYLLRDMDEAISKLDVLYYRYSDDLLILGPDADKAKAIAASMLAAKGLQIHPRKCMPVDASTRFTFLGFDICGGNLTFSKPSLLRIKKDIRSMTKTRKGQDKRSEEVLRKVIGQINHKLYVAHMVNDREFGWGEYFLGTVTVEDDIRMLDEYVKDHIRHVYTGKWNGASNYHKVPNDMLRRCGYVSMVHLWKLRRISASLYRNEVRMRMV